MLGAKGGAHMAFDYKREYKEFYLPPQKPQLIRVPEMRFAAVRGQGDPNEEGGAYQRALSALYALCYTLKMSKLGDHRIEGYFDYVVPPLEGLWWQEGAETVDLSRKDALSWISMIRLPDFVREEDFRWAQAEAARKKGLDCSAAEYFAYAEGDCVQCLHVGPYEEEPATLTEMRAFAAQNGWRLDVGDARRHHEIYLSDPRRVAPEKRKTVLRLPVVPGGA